MAPIGFVILTHSNPSQITRLIRCLNALYSRPPIVLHHDFSQCRLELPLSSNVRIVQPSIVTGWGQFSIVRATLAGMSTLLSEGDKPKWFSLLSGSCYPTKQAEDVLRDLEEGGYDAYLYHELIDPMAPRSMFHKVCVWRYFNWNLPFPGGHAAGYRSIRTPKVLASQTSCYQQGFACYAGAQWFTARSHVAEYILRWSAENSWLAEHLSHRIMPDETYFHSIVCNEKHFRVSQKNYRYVDWSAGGSHPKILGIEDLQFILKSGSHFARKFASGSDVLDALDRHLEIDLEEKLEVGSVDSRGSDCIPAPCDVPADTSFAEDATNKRISVVIPTFRRARLLEKALLSLEAQTDSNFEVIVVCDGPDAETKKLSESYRATMQLKWLFRDQQEHQAAARNAGVSLAKGEILLFLDDDATADPNWIRTHRKWHESQRGGPPVVVLGRTIRVYDEPPFSRSERLLREEGKTRDSESSSVLSNPDAHSVEDLQLNSVCGFNCSVDRSIFLKAGGYDANMQPNFEDFELGQRLHSIGVEIVVDGDAVLTHHDTKKLVDDSLSYWRHGIRLALYRFKKKGQRNAQMFALRNLRTANPARRLHQELSWRAPGVMRACGGVAQKLCDRTGSRWFLRQWMRLQALPEGLRSLRTEGVTLKQARQLVGKPLLVLAIHDIKASLSEEDKNYHISSDKFRAVLKTLATLKYQCVTASEGLVLQNGKHYLLTIDDGFEELHSELLPLIATYKLKPLIFVVVNKIGGFHEWESPMGFTRRKLLSLDQMRELKNCGVEFGSHTCTHAWLPSLTEADLWREVNDSKRKLEDLLGSEVTSFAYPYGGANAHVRATVARAGYERAFSVSPGLSFWDDPMWIRRVEVAENDSYPGLLLKLLTGKSGSQRLYEQLRRFRKLMKVVR